MHRCIAILVAVVCAIGSPVSLRAADGAPSGGTLLLGGRSYQLSNVVAYETKSGDDVMITLLAGNRLLPIERIKTALRDGGGNDDSLSLNQPHVKVVFSKSGEVQSCHASADNASFATSGGERLTGELKLAGDRLTAKADLAPRGDGETQESFALRFDGALGLDNAQQKPRVSGPVKPEVSGKFTGNGKPAKLAYLSAHWTKALDDKSAVVLLFTEKDHANKKRPESGAAFGDFGSALIISVDEDGDIFGCEVAHDAHEKKPFSSVGRIRMADFELGPRYAIGQITTDGELDTFEQKWEVDLKFAAPLPARANSPAAPQPPAAKKPADPSPAKPEPASMNLRQIPLPENATNVQYKPTVGQIVFDSSSKVQALAADLSKMLEAQAWAKKGADLSTPNSAILNRAKGQATLTIMVKPAESGSQVTIFSTGLK
jgi:hypothetical protein